MPTQYFFTGAGPTETVIPEDRDRVYLQIKSHENPLADYGAQVQIYVCDDENTYADNHFFILMPQQELILTAHAGKRPDKKYVLTGSAAYHGSYIWQPQQQKDDPQVPQDVIVKEQPIRTRPRLWPW